MTHQQQRSISLNGFACPRRGWRIVGAAVIVLAAAATIRPGKTPPYLQSLTPVKGGWGWATYESRDEHEALTRALEGDWAKSDQWSAGGNITYSDVCNNYMANRFLYVEWGWPKDDLLRIEVRRPSLLEAVFSRN